MIMFPTFLFPLYSVPTGPVQLMFRGVSYSNNTQLFIGDIGDISTGSAILCTTNRGLCCSINRLGEWYYPNGSLVPNNAAGEDFYRSRSHNQTIYLNRRNNAWSPGGSFCCEIPDSNDMIHRHCVSVGKFFLFSIKLTEELML